MSKTNITPSDLTGLISKLKGWGQQMDSMRGSMQSYSSQLQSSWNDPQYEMYVQKVKSLANMMKVNADDLERTAQTLDIMKRNLERTSAEVRSRLR